MAKKSGPRCACWEATVGKGELEGVLARMRHENHGAIIQAFGADEVPNPRALQMLAAQTLEAAKSSSTLADKAEMDLLLRIAGTRQIGDALRRVGYASGRKHLFLVAASEGGEVESLRRRLGKDGRFAELPARSLGSGDLDKVERAALLAARL